MATGNGAPGPPFAFQIYELNDVRDPQYQHTRYGTGAWIPPQTFRDNDWELIFDEHSFFYFDGSTVHLYPPGSFPMDAIHNAGEVSVYHNEGQIYGCGEDVTEPPTPEPHEPPLEVMDIGWKCLAFVHENDQSYVSRAVFHEGGVPRLTLLRPSQVWAKELLPCIYRPHHVHDDSPQNSGLGGLKGEVAILIALIALSVPNGNIHLALFNCMRGLTWTSHGLPRDEGWTSRRGILVKVFTLSEDTTPLRLFEDGTVAEGKIFH
ncbi:hypothetical protein P152DRAFT_297375 [Eremomyces bilateralis CBS 781.70]|uniref:Uncharacterized protein n=1 Tax=Eremomyces bilateralis CBS 781.70 TaxID=1392243 RepID=A0A6G1G744_9PEZI|nr:uncharacterized protein P152DRAFT_297375 [Eremomyces bilateralis CBS 781.70]KAF1813905.1 hypothetical protein P152DRAFT_297375 [Eremomyces bilateralis CBS 781.70]